MNKKVIIAILVSILLISLVGITFAAFTYSRTGTSNSKQLVGDIYMHYTESNNLTLENAMPSSSYIANKYFQFSIDGKNTTTNKDIYYDITLSHGSVPTGKTESNRILDMFLRFRLVEVINSSETVIFNNWRYFDIENKKIHVETIQHNTNSQITHTYRLYMWITDSILIGVGGNEDYSLTDWTNLFASIKVNASGDFTVKTVDDPTSIPTMSEMCPGCVYTYTTNSYYTTWNTLNQTPTVLTSSDYEEDYEDVVTASGKNVFLGMKLNNNNQIEKAYSCGIYDNHPFCIEGTVDESKYYSNIDYLYRIYGEYDDQTELGCRQISNGYGYDLDCRGSINAEVYYNYGRVESHEQHEIYGYSCKVYENGSLICSGITAPS